MKNLNDILIMFRGNQTKAAELLGINRGALRNNLESNGDYLIHEGKVYKKIGKPNFLAMSDEEKRAEFIRGCGGEG